MRNVVVSATVSRLCLLSMANSGPLPPLERLQELLNYDPATGVFTWRKSRGCVNAGAPAGGLSTNGYIRIAIDRRKYSAQRIAWFMQTGQDPGDLCIDHIDSNITNNSFSNLRLCTISQNNFNRSSYKGSSSKYKGVSYQKSKNKWRAYIAANGKNFYLGSFDTEELAHQAYCDASQHLHGDFARFS